MATAPDAKHLVELLRHEPAVLNELFGCVSRLAEVQAAKAQLATLDARSLRTALEESPGEDAGGDDR